MLFRRWFGFVVSFGGHAPHVLRAHMGHTRGEPNEFWLAAAYGLLLPPLYPNEFGLTAAHGLFLPPLFPGQRIEYADPGVQLDDTHDTRGKVSLASSEAFNSTPMGGTFRFRFRLAPRTHVPWGAFVASLTKSRGVPTRNVLPPLSRGQGADQFRDARIKDVASRKSGGVFWVGILLDLIRPTTRAMHLHGAYVRGARRYRD